MNERNGLIVTGIAPLYQEPEEGVLIDEGLLGMNLEILGKVNEDWLHIRMEYGYEGFVHAGHVRQGSWSDFLSDGDTLVRVLKQQIDVLKAPKVASCILQTMPRGSVLIRKADGAACRSDAAHADEWTELPAGWVMVVLPDGRTGYTKEGYLGAFVPISRSVPSDEEAFRNAVVQSALSYQGTAYRWGGKSPQGIDCSGLCAMAYLMNGVIIYRDAAIKEGYPLKEIPLSDIKQGDLLFFPGHVALYLGGERKLYLHSTAKAGSDGVDLNSLVKTDPLFREDLAGSITAVGSLYGGTSGVQKSSDEAEGVVHGFVTA